MTITWYGEGCFKIQTEGVVITTDPVEKESGLTPPRFKTDIIINTQLHALSGEELKPIGSTTEETQTIAGPGEYEIKGISITGWPLTKNLDSKMLRSVFRIKAEGLTLGILGAIAQFNEPEIIEEFGDIDILFIPANGTPFINAEDAAKLVRQINPKIIIPSHMKVPGLKRKADGPENFLKEIGLKAEPEEKLSIKQKDLEEKLKVALLKKT